MEQLRPPSPPPPSEERPKPSFIHTVQGLFAALIMGVTTPPDLHDLGEGFYAAPIVCANGVCQIEGGEPAKRAFTPVFPEKDPRYVHPNLENVSSADHTLRPELDAQTQA